MDTSSASPSFFSRGKSYIIGSLGGYARSTSNTTTSSVRTNNISYHKDAEMAQSIEDPETIMNKKYMDAFSGFDRVSSSKQQRYSQAVDSATAFYSSQPKEVTDVDTHDDIHGKNIKNCKQHSSLSSCSQSKIDKEETLKERCVVPCTATSSSNQESSLFHQTPPQFQARESKAIPYNWHYLRPSPAYINSADFIQHDASDSLLESLIKLDLGRTHGILYAAGLRTFSDIQFLSLSELLELNFNDRDFQLLWLSIHELKEVNKRKKERLSQLEGRDVTRGMSHPIDQLQCQYLPFRGQTSDGKLSIRQPPNDRQVSKGKITSSHSVSSHIKVAQVLPSSRAAYSTRAQNNPTPLPTCAVGKGSPPPPLSQRRSMITRSSKRLPSNTHGAASSCEALVLPRSHSPHHMSKQEVPLSTCSSGQAFQQQSQSGDERRMTFQEPQAHGMEQEKRRQFEQLQEQHYPCVINKSQISCSGLDVFQTPYRRVDFQIERLSDRYSIFKGRFFNVEQCQQILRMAELYAYKHSGWRPEIYTLTNLDLHVKAVPGMLDIIHPFMEQLMEDSREMFQGCYDTRYRNDNEPHLVKYTGKTHRGVCMHTDSADITVNIALSDPRDFVGGGTYFEAINKNIVLEQGEMLFHSGALKHQGINISSGIRTLLVSFFSCKWENDSQRS